MRHSRELAISRCRRIGLAVLAAISFTGDLDGMLRAEQLIFTRHSRGFN
jgi:hypothetical protein